MIEWRGNCLWERSWHLPPPLLLLSPSLSLLSVTPSSPLKLHFPFSPCRLLSSSIFYRPSVNFQIFSSKKCWASVPSITYTLGRIGYYVSNAVTLYFAHRVCLWITLCLRTDSDESLKCQWKTPLYYGDQFFSPWGRAEFYFLYLSDMNFSI